MFEIKKNIFTIFPINIFKEDNFLSTEDCDIIFDFLMNQKSVDHGLLIGDAKSSYGLRSNILDNLPQKYDQITSKIQERIDYFGNICECAPSQLSLSWFNIQNENSRLLPHAHDGSVASGALYINTDDNSTLEFINPNYAILSHHSIERYILRLKPQKGTLVIFPSYLAHGNWYSENKTENRIVISFNSRIKVQENMSDNIKQIKCGCGRSPTGYCIGLHSMTNEQYKAHLDQQQKSLNEQAKPQLLRD